MKTALIIGGGVAGCAAAHQLTLMGGWNVTLIERGPYLGAGVRTFFHGGHPYTFGPRHFLTQNEKVFEYLNTYCPLRLCADHQFITYVPDDAQFYNFPIHIDDVIKMPDRDQIYTELGTALNDVTPTNFEEFWIRSVGKTLYNKMINNYSKKMWKRYSNQELDTFNWSPKGVALKSGSRTAWDTAISAYPYAHDGYNQWLDTATLGVNVRLNTEISSYEFGISRRIWIDKECVEADIIISTISPDIPFKNYYGKLPYIGRDFHKIVLPIEFAFPENVYFVYDAGTEAFTRLVEYKKFTHHKSPHTLLGLEIPSFNGNHYPLPILEWQRLAEHYFQRMASGVFSMGRSGSYRYGLDIGACISQAMELRNILEQGGWEHPVPLTKWRL